MAPKPLEFRKHALIALAERGLEAAWVEAAVRRPDWIEPDPDPALERRFRAIAEREGRILRVVCAEFHDRIVIVTAFLDRKARRPG